MKVYCFSQVLSWSRCQGGWLWGGCCPLPSCPSVLSEEPPVPDLPDLHPGPPPWQWHHVWLDSGAGEHRDPAEHWPSWYPVPAGHRRHCRHRFNWRWHRCRPCRCHKHSLAPIPADRRQFIVNGGNVNRDYSSYRGFSGWQFKCYKWSKLVVCASGFHDPRSFKCCKICIKIIKNPNWRCVLLLRCTIVNVEWRKMNIYRWYLVSRCFICLYV